MHGRNLTSLLKTWVIPQLFVLLTSFNLIFEWDWSQDHGKYHHSLEDPSCNRGKEGSEERRLSRLRTWCLGRYEPWSTCNLSLLKLIWDWSNSIPFNRFQSHTANNLGEPCSDLRYELLMGDLWNIPTLYRLVIRLESMPSVMIRQSSFSHKLERDVWSWRMCRIGHCRLMDRRICLAGVCFFIIPATLYTLASVEIASTK